MSGEERINKVDLQEMIFALQHFWDAQGCLIGLPYDVEKGAGTMNPLTFLRVLGPEPWSVAYVEPSRRPADARYGQNPNRLYQHHQFQVVIKPSPDDIQERYLSSLETLGIYRREHDIRFVEDNWESPTLGAWGLGWEVWLDGMEITQFTYFQQVGGIDCRPVSVEITYGLERLAAYVQDKESVFDLIWGHGIRYDQLFRQAEFEHATFAFESADPQVLLSLFETYEQEAARLLQGGLVMPGYDDVLKCSHLFNLLDARGALAVSQRAAFIGRVRRLAQQAARTYLAQREEAGYPLLQQEAIDVG